MSDRDVLLDTHLVLWAAADDDRLRARTRDLMRNADQRWVSAASAYEIALKVRLGRLPGGAEVLDRWSQLLRQLRASELSLSCAHMARAGNLDWAHRDPFDRMLVAQAQLEGLTVLTDDRAIGDYADVRSRC